ncbi:MAG: MerR family transcriptional regulator [Gammaproteobacteria bacterium]|nr:MerR family transcriptional regulator [Gammaproteobacteria bacterium]
MYIGVAARRSGLSVKAIRFYESVGLIPAPPRTGRYRRYDEDTLELLSLIKEAKNLGLTIAELKAMIVWVDGKVDWRQVADFLVAQKQRVHEDIQRLQQQLIQIDNCLAQMTSCPHMRDVP